MTESERLRDDLAYVRAAVERQRQAVCDTVPVWFAAAAGGYFLMLALLRDFSVQEVIGKATLEWINTIGTAILVVIVLTRAYQHRRRAGSEAKPRLRWRDQLRQATPFLIFVAGIVFIKFYADAADIDVAAMQPVFIAYVAVSFMLIGLGGLRLLLWMGAGLAVGLLGYVALDPELKRTLLAAGLGTGMVFGSWLDSRMLARSAS